MAQTILHIDQITRAAAKVLEGSLGFTRAINRQYSDEYAKTGAKVGDTIRIRLPFRPVVSSGRVANVQEYIEESTNLQVNNQNHIALQFTSAERALALDDFEERVLRPQLASLAAYIDWQVINSLWYKIPNLVGTPGTVPANMQVWGDAMARLDDGLAPRGNKRWAIVSPDAMARTTYGASALFHKSTNIADQYVNGVVEDAIGMRWMMDQSLVSLTNGTRTANDCLIDDAAGAFNTEGTTTIHIDDFDSATDGLKKGEVLYIAGVYDVHPITKQTLGYLKRFTVTADATASGSETDVSVYPPMYSSASGGKQNVSAFPADGAIVTNVTGAASSGPYQHNIVMHEDWATFATADLAMPDSGEASRARAGNIAVRVWRQSDIINDTHICRLDVLWGCTDIYPHWACRVTN